MKKLIFLFFMLIGWMSGNGQENRDNGTTRVSNYIELNDYTGFDSPCQSDLETIAGEVKTLLQTGGTEVKIVVAKVYPPSVYMNKEAGVNAMVALTKEQVSDQYANYILFLAEILDDSSVKISLHHRINVTLPGKCSTNSQILFEGLRIDISKDFINLVQVECIVKTSLSNLKLRLQQGCSYDANEVAKYLKSEGFQIIPLNRFNVEYGNETGIKGNIKEGSRNLCQIVDYTNGNMKINQTEVRTLLDSPLFSGVTRRTVISSYLTFADTTQTYSLSSLINAEINTEFPSCDVNIVVHFLGKQSDGIDYVGIGMKIGTNPGSYGNYTYSQIKDLAATGNMPLQSQFLSISYKTKDLMSSQRDKLETLLPDIVGKNFVISSIDFTNGLFSGIFDGFIETVDVIGLLGQLMYHHQSQLKNSMTTGGVFFLADCMYHMYKMRGFMAGMQDKFDTDYEFNLQVQNFLDMVSKVTIDQVLNFCWIMIKDAAKDIIGMNGTFEAGYIRGKLVFEVIVAVLTGGVGEVKNVMTFMKNTGTLLKNIAEKGANIAKTKADDIVRLISANMDDLVRAIENLLNLKKWYSDGMAPLVKGRLLDWAQNNNLTTYLLKLDADMTKMSSPKQWLQTKGPDGLDSWRYLEEAFPEPHHIWCIP